MYLSDPHFLINFKVYDGTSGEDGLALAKTIESVQSETAANFAVAPQTPDLRLVDDPDLVVRACQSASE